MNTESKFTTGQEVWLKVIIENPKLDCDGDIGVIRRYRGGEKILTFASASDIRTTEQILQEHGASAPQNNLELTSEEKMKKFEVITETVTEQLKNWEWDDEDRVWRPKTANEGDKTPHNAELTDQKAEPCDGDECWVKAKLLDPHPDRDGDYNVLIENNFTDIEQVYARAENVRFTEPTHSTAIIELIEPDRTRKFKKGDKVKRREELLYGRTLDIIFPLLPYGKTLIVETDEDSNGEVGIFYGGITRYVPFFILDLVEPAPEPKFWVHESPKTYSIYCKGKKGEVITAMLLRKDIYTLKEAQEQCDKLNSKDQDND